MKTALDSLDVLVSRPMGGWKYGRPYAVSTYLLLSNKEGKLVWKFAGRSRKYSKPQIKRYNISANYPYCQILPLKTHYTLESHPNSPYNKD